MKKTTSKGLEAAMCTLKEVIMAITDTQILINVNGSADNGRWKAKMSVCRGQKSGREHEQRMVRRFLLVDISSLAQAVH